MKQTKCTHCNGKGTVPTLIEDAYYWMRPLSYKTWGTARWDGETFSNLDGTYTRSEVEIGPRLHKPKELK